MRPDASKLGLLAGHTHDVVDGQLLTTTAYRCGHIPHPGTEITLDHLQGSRCVGASVLTVRLAAISRPLCRARLSVSRAVQCTMTIKQRSDANVAASAPPTSGQSLQNLCKFLLDGGGRISIPRKRGSGGTPSPLRVPPEFLHPA
jgi:hypothetical protein